MINPEPRYKKAIQLVALVGIRTREMGTLPGNNFATVPLLPHYLIRDPLIVEATNPGTH
jgi:hypothetical protein